MTKKKSQSTGPRPAYVPMKRQLKYDDPLNVETRARFLHSLTEGWSVASSIRRATGRVGVVRTFYQWRADHPDFAAAWEEAYSFGTSVFEDEARRRAVEGWNEPVFRGDGQVGEIRKFSDRLLEFMLVSRDERYNPRRNDAPTQVKVVVTGGLPSLEVVEEPQPESGD